MADSGNREAKDETENPILALGRVGLSLTTAATVYLYFVGAAYWSTLLGRFGLDPWSVEVPFLRYLVPDPSSLSLLTNAAITYAATSWLARKARSEKSAESRLTNATALAQKAGISFQLLAEFVNDPNAKEIVGLVSSGERADAWREVILESEGTAPAVARLTDAPRLAAYLALITDAQYQGYRSLLRLKKILEAPKDGALIDEINTAAETARNHMDNFEPSKMEKVVNTGLFSLGLAAVVLSIIHSPATLVPAIIGSVVGIALCGALRLKDPSTRVSVLLLLMLVAVGNAAWGGHRDASVARHAWLEIDDGTHAVFRIVASNSRGVYVVEDSTKTRPRLTRFIRNEQIKAIRWAVP